MGKIFPRFVRMINHRSIPPLHAITASMCLAVTGPSFLMAVNLGTWERYFLDFHEKSFGNFIFVKFPFSAFPILTINPSCYQKYISF